MAEERATLSYGGDEFHFDVVRGTEGGPGIDVNRLRAETGLVALDYGFANTASCQSEISFVDGAEGRLDLLVGSFDALLFEHVAGEALRHASGLDRPACGCAAT